MPDLTPGQLVWLAAVATIAGIVRGFSGFGTALIYVPLAGTVLPPLGVLISLTIMDMVGPLPNVPRAIRDGQPRKVLGIAAVAVVFLLPGLWLLDLMDDTLFRWLVSGLCLLTVLLMASGWRWSGNMSRPVMAGAGAVSGFLGGLSGLAGPPVTLVYMSAPFPAAVIRASILLYLVIWDVMFGAVLLVQGKLALDMVLLGAALIIPYLAANVVGARLFNPTKERAYRLTAYIIIACSAVMALPLWG